MSLLSPSNLRTGHTTISTFLLPFLQTRHASILGSLSDVPSAYSKRIRKGRGPAAGKGKTSGRGHNGQKQHGKVPRGFQGGQTPLEGIKGLRGFENQHSVEMTTINLDKIQSWIDQGRIDPSKPITLKELQESRCLHGIKDGVKLLARNANDLRTPIHIIVSRASASAISAVEAAGGSVQTRYYTWFSIRNILKGLIHPTQSRLSQSQVNTTSDSTDVPSPPPSAHDPFAAHFPPPKNFRYRLPDPVSRKDLEYYRDPAHRGYLAYQVPKGDGPSLFFKTPRKLQRDVEVASEKKRASRPDQTVKTERMF
ncbi:MAG: YmL10 [Chrysothrix sp. TS-e1954]|nr:MAG: YmL10 [Chrysothrix sp. TS-e1954]